MIKKIIGQIHWVIIAFSVLGIYNDYEVSQKKINEAKSLTQPIRNRISQAKKKIKKMNDFEEDLAKTRERVEDIQKQIKKAQRQLPNQTSDTAILDTFKSSTQGINIKDIFLQPGKEVEKGFYFSKDYQFKGKGTWLQFLIFFETLLKNERLFNVKELTMSRSSRGRRGQFQFIDVVSKMEAFRYNPNFEESSDEIKSIENNKGNNRNRRRKRK